MNIGDIFEKFGHHYVGIQEHAVELAISSNPDFLKKEAKDLVSKVARLQRHAKGYDIDIVAFPPLGEPWDNIFIREIVFNAFDSRKILVKPLYDSYPSPPRFGNIVHSSANINNTYVSFNPGIEVEMLADKEYMVFEAHDGRVEVLPNETIGSFTYDRVKLLMAVEFRRPATQGFCVIKGLYMPFANLRAYDLDFLMECLELEPIIQLQTNKARQPQPQHL
mgnify:CR=1 FL=1